MKQLGIFMCMMLGMAGAVAFGRITALDIPVDQWRLLAAILVGAVGIAVPAALAMSAVNEKRMLADALGWALSELEGATHYDTCDQYRACMARAQQIFAEAAGR